MYPVACSTRQKRRKDGVSRSLTAANVRCISTRLTINPCLRCFIYIKEHLHLSCNRQHFPGQDWSKNLAHASCSMIAPNRPVCARQALAERLPSQVAEQRSALQASGRNVYGRAAGHAVHDCSVGWLSSPWDGFRTLSPNEFFRQGVQRESMGDP